MGDRENFEESTPSRNIFANRKLIVIVFLIVLAAVILGAFFSLSKNSSSMRKKDYKYVITFERLEEAEASKLREELSYEGFHFKTKIEGKFSQIELREDEADDARIKMAQKGLPAGGVVGFEIFDKSSSLGVTDFDKRIKFIRALCGELSRNISRINSIENARVQIVLPEEKIFSFKKPEVTASVLVQRKRGSQITVDQIRGIMHLMAASVESLRPENVTVVDMEGHILSEQVFDLKPITKRPPTPELGVTEEDTTAEGTNTDSSTSGMATNVSVDGVKVLKNQPSGQVAVFPKSSEISPATTSPSPAVTVDYFTFKSSLEQDLTQKVSDVLTKLFPDGSTSLVVTVELLPSKNSGIPRIKSKSILLLVDDTSVSMNQTLKKTTISSIASIMGYVKKRDRIELRRASFTNTAIIKSKPEIQHFFTKKTPPITDNQQVQATQSTPQTVENVAVKGASFNGRSIKQNPIKSLKQSQRLDAQLKFFNIKYLLIVFATVVLLVLASIFIKKRRNSNNFNSEFDSELFGNNRDQNMMSDLKNDVDETSSPLDTHPEVERIRNIIEDDPDKIASVLKDWLTESKEE